MNAEGDVVQLDAGNSQQIRDAEEALRLSLDAAMALEMNAIDIVTEARAIANREIRRAIEAGVKRRVTTDFLWNIEDAVQTAVRFAVEQEFKL